MRTRQTKHCFHHYHLDGVKTQKGVPLTCDRYRYRCCRCNRITYKRTKVGPKGPGECKQKDG